MRDDTIAAFLDQLAARVPAPGLIGVGFVAPGAVVVDVVDAAAGA